MVEKIEDIVYLTNDQKMEVRQAIREGVLLITNCIARLVKQETKKHNE